MRKDILMAGLGWISSGLICFVVWAIERGFENASGLLYTGLVVIIIGTWLLLLNRKLEKTIKKFENEAKMRGAKRVKR